MDVMDDTLSIHLTLLGRAEDYPDALIQNRDPHFNTSVIKAGLNGMRTDAERLEETRTLVLAENRQRVLDLENELKQERIKHDERLDEIRRQSLEEQRQRVSELQEELKQERLCHQDRLEELRCQLTNQTNRALEESRQKICALEQDLRDQRTTSAEFLSQRESEWASMATANLDVYRDRIVSLQKEMEMMRETQTSQKSVISQLEESVLKRYEEGLKEGRAISATINAGVEGESWVQEHLEKISGGVVTDTSCQPHSGDFSILLDDDVLIMIEVKNVLTLKTEEVDKFKRDLQVTKSHAGICFSLRDTSNKEPVVIGNVGDSLYLIIHDVRSYPSLVSASVQMLHSMVMQQRTLRGLMETETGAVTLRLTDLQSEINGILNGPFKKHLKTMKSHATGILNQVKCMQDSIYTQLLKAVNNSNSTDAPEKKRRR